MCIRDRDWDGTPVFPARELRTLEVAYTDAERQAHGWLQELSLIHISEPTRPY